MVKFLLSLLIFLVLVSSTAYAINIGSIVSRDSANVSVGESVKFKMLFWNSEDENYTLRLSAIDYPEDWIIIIDPNEFILNKNMGEEYIKLPYKEENIKAKVVNLFVKPDEKSLTGSYSVSIESQAITENEGTMSIIPGSIISFKINVNNIEAEEDNINDVALIENETVIVSDSAKKEDENNLSLYLVLFIIIFVFSIALYKKS